MDDEIFVRQHMEVCVGASGTIWFQGLPQFGRWSEARVWLDGRLKQIAEVKEEIAFIEARLRVANIKEMPIRSRILAREQAALDELRRGMKGLKA
jgi:hypothetical protein